LTHIPKQDIGFMMQMILFDEAIAPRAVRPFTAQLLKWIGNKQRFAHEIASYFPEEFNCYFEPFIGSGAVLATLSPKKAVGSDTFRPLVEIWKTLRGNPELLKQWYAERWASMRRAGDKAKGYEEIKASYNRQPNGADLLFLCRSCYGGVVRFRQGDGYMSTPCGIHEPILPESFANRVDDWHERTAGSEFLCLPYEDAMTKAQEGDLIYCDPPYSHSQTILYGAQAFDLEHLFRVIQRCKERGVYVALSIDGTKKSGVRLCELPVPDGLFEREIFVHCGRSMLRRFQMGGQSLEQEVVADRLLLTY
jgi:DNA adenine methylase